MRQELRADALLLVSATIWGFAFVAQRAAMQHIGPFTFNGVRFALGTLVLGVYLLWRKPREWGKKGRRGGRRPEVAPAGEDPGAWEEAKRYGKIASTKSRRLSAIMEPTEFPSPPR